MSKQVIHELGLATEQGEMTFPQVVKGLLEIGVESYLVDFAANQKTHYLADGSTEAMEMILPPRRLRRSPIPSLVAAIRGAQADTVRYPEFVKRATAAGVIGYSAFLTASGSIYFGRKATAYRRRVPRAAEKQAAKRRKPSSGFPIAADFDCPVVLGGVRLQFRQPVQFGDLRAAHVPYNSPGARSITGSIARSRASPASVDLCHTMRQSCRSRRWRMNLRAFSRGAGGQYRARPRSYASRWPRKGAQAVDRRRAGCGARCIAWP